MNNEQTINHEQMQSDYLTNKINGVVKGSAGYVIFFGVFTLTCLILQCVDLLIDLYGYNLPYFNKNFIIPVDTLTTLYATLCCVYIGVDRTTSVIATLKGSKNTSNYGSPERNRHIIIQNFIICSIAIILNRFFDVNLGIESLMLSFGGSIILYVSGQKFVYQASKFAPEIDKNCSGIDDRIEADIKLINTLNRSVRDSKKIKIYTIDLNGNESLEYTNIENYEQDHDVNKNYQECECQQLP